MVRSSFEAADFFMDEPIFLKNMRIFKKKSARYMGKYALLNLMRSTLLRLADTNPNRTLLKLYKSAFYVRYHL